MHERHPVTLVVRDDLRRSRLTVFFRLLLFIPHAIWLTLWSIAVIVGAVAGWIAALALGRLPGSLHRFFSAYIRYTVHLAAYLTLAANPYPEFTGSVVSYPVDVELPGPVAQSRWRILFRLVLAIPATMISVSLGGWIPGGYASTSTKGTSTGVNGNASGLGFAAALLGWFASVFTGRMPRGLRDAGAYSAGYRAQVLAYLLLVTPRYPDADPTELLDELDRPPLHPVRIVGDSTDLRRSRVTVLFRLPLAIPHVVWLGLWTVLAVPTVVIQWLVTLVIGRPIRKLHAFLARYVRYSFVVYAFLFLVANPFPGFTGKAGQYPLDLVLPPPGRQKRLKTAFRGLLAIPAWIFGGALGSVLTVAAILSWFASLAKGSAPEGLRNLSAYAVRYGGQVNAYVFLITDAYPHASPLEGADPVVEPTAEAAEPLAA